MSHALGDAVAVAAVRAADVVGVGRFMQAPTATASWPAVQVHEARHRAGLHFAAHALFELADGTHAPIRIEQHHRIVGHGDFLKQKNSQSGLFFNLKRFRRQSESVRVLRCSSPSSVAIIKNRIDGFYLKGYQYPTGPAPFARRRSPGPCCSTANVPCRRWISCGLDAIVASRSAQRLLRLRVLDAHLRMGLPGKPGDGDRARATPPGPPILVVPEFAIAA